MSLRLRISLVITLVMAAFTIAMVYVIVNDLRSSVREEIESTTRVAVQLTETLVAGVYLEPGPAKRTEALLLFLRRVGRVRANDIRFYDESGALLYESPPSTYHAGSRAPEWFSRLVRPDVPAVRLALPGGAIVVTPDPSLSIAEGWDALQSFALLAAAFLVLVNAVVFWLLDRALEQNRRVSALIQSRLEAERRAIARELHDELAQCVTAIKSIGTAIASRAGEARPEIRDNAETIVSVASHIYDIVHGIIRRLRPSGLDHLGLAETLRDAVSGWSQRHPQVRWELALAGELEGLGEGLNITVYRIVQEALTNVVRHAQASRVLVSVAREQAARFEDAVVVCVRDDGKGLGQAAAQEQARFGLAGMRERVQAFGGSFAISGEPGRGVTVRAVLPVPVAGAERAAALETRA